jgi:hypothetical protein
MRGEATFRESDALLGILQNHFQTASDFAKVFQLFSPKVMESTDTFNRNADYCPFRCPGRFECDRFQPSNYASAIFLKGENP